MSIESFLSIVVDLFVCCFAMLMLRRDVIRFVIRRFFLVEFLAFSEVFDHDDRSNPPVNCARLKAIPTLCDNQVNSDRRPRDGYGHRIVKTKRGAKWAARIKSFNVINRQPTTHTHHVSIARAHSRRRGLNGIFSFHFASIETETLKAFNLPGIVICRLA